MDVREKLVELLDDALLSVDWDGNDYPDTEKAIDILIANGVTVQGATDNNAGCKWISVKDRLPESGKEVVMIALRWGEVDVGWCEDEKWDSEFVNEYEDGEVTHWMPLPEPPKGE